MYGDFQVKAVDGTVFCGRTMEFPIRQNSEIVTYNKNEQFESTTPDGTKGFSWTSKYGFTGINAFHLDVPDEGMNEAGLSFGVLVMNGTKYLEEIPKDQNDRALAMMDVGKWILGSFATVKEVEQAINDVLIWGQFIKPMNQIPGLHIALHDAEGGNAVIEIVDCKVNFYNNPNGVLTNEPPLPEQLENLKKYADVQPEKGMAGMPGSWLPTDRFVRISLMSHPKEVAIADRAQAFDQVTRILNATDLPRGVEICNFVNHKLEISTLWATAKDLTNRVFYFRPHGDMTYRSIDLNKLNFEPGTEHPKLPVYTSNPTIIDITNQLGKPKGMFSWARAKAEPVVYPSTLVPRNPEAFEKIINFFNDTIQGTGKVIDNKEYCLKNRGQISLI